MTNVKNNVFRPGNVGKLATKMFLKLCGKVFAFQETQGPQKIDNGGGGGG